ncbi:MAG: MATE family efflux transporter [Clostridia bacterium]|nr:MATE family efflux transporter [Clostridia bacterium]
MARANEMDLTSGSIFKKLIIYAIPFIFTNILQILFNAADIAVVGIFVGDDAVAAVGANTSLSTLLVGMFVGLSIGSNVVLGRYVGARSVEEAHRTVGSSILLALVSGFILLAIGVPLAETFLRWMDCDEQILGMATTYLRIYFLGMPIMMLYNFCASILRAVGDTKRPLIFLLIGGVVNVVLNVFFVCVLNMTVEGVAIATITSQAISAGLSLIVLIRSDGYGALKFKHFRFYKEQVKEIMIIGVPSAIQSAAFNISNVLIQSTVNSFGKIGMSANTTAAQFDGVIYNVGNAISMSAMAFVSQNIGAKRMDRVKSVILNGVFVVFIFQFSVGAIFALLGPFLCGIIASSQEVVELATVRLSILGLFYFMCGIMEVFANSLRGMGKPIVALIVSIMGASVFRIIFLEITMLLWPGFATIYWSYPASWAFTILTYLLILPRTYKKVRSKIEENETVKA